MEKESDMPHVFVVLPRQKKYDKMASNKSSCIYTYDFKNEYVSLTDIAKYRSIDPRVTIHNWLRGRDIVEFLGLWESLHNPNFKRIEFETFKEDAGSNLHHGYPRNLNFI